MEAAGVPVDAPDDDVGVICSDEDAAAWYAAAAAGDLEEDEGGGPVEEAAEDEEAQGDAPLLSDPYSAGDGAAGPGDGAAGALEAASDPYLAIGDPYQAVAAIPEQPPTKKQRTQDGDSAQAPQLAAVPDAGGLAAPVGGQLPLGSVRIKLQEGIDEPAPVAAPAAGMPMAPAGEQVTSATWGQALQPPPAPPMPALPGIKAHGTKIDLDSHVVDIPADEAPLVKEVEDDEDPDASLPWDERVIVVRQGQIHIELQNQNPPMHDPTLLKFCDWLDEQMPLVVTNFPYIKKSGAYVDLSDNVIGPEGLDKLFRVLRDHRVPCVVLKAYRNVLDDSIVDTLIEYLYTQPEAFPMHGIHMSHNSITETGAQRLIRAACKCGHYPRLTSRLPLWLRLECNDIQNPLRVITGCFAEGHNVCLMKDGMCSRRDCNHYTGVNVQLPYFLNQGRRWNGKPGAQQDAAEPRQNQAVPSLVAQPGAPDLASAAPKKPEGEPDWVARPSIHTPVVLGVPAPKTIPAPVRTPGETAPPAGEQASPGIAAPRGVFKRPWQGQGGGKGHSGSHGAGGGGACGWGSWWDSKGYGKGKAGGAGLGYGPRHSWGGRGGGWRPHGVLWQGPALDTKIRKEMKLVEEDVYLGFQWRFPGEGKPPQVCWVDPRSKVGFEVTIGENLLRINGLDAAMFTEKQVNDMLKQRPLTLRFGDL